MECPTCAGTNVREIIYGRLEPEAEEKLFCLRRLCAWRLHHLP